MNELPVWYDGKKINEVAFCQAFLQKRPMVCVKGSFFSVDHRNKEHQISVLAYQRTVSGTDVRKYG